MESGMRNWHTLDDRTTMDYPTPLKRGEYVTNQGNLEIHFDWHEFYEQGRQAAEAAHRVALAKQRRECLAKIGRTSQVDRHEADEEEDRIVFSGHTSREELSLSYPLPPCALLLANCEWEPQADYCAPRLHKDLSSTEMAEASRIPYQKAAGG